MAADSVAASRLACVCLAALIGVVPSARASQDRPNGESVRPPVQSIDSDGRVTVRAVRVEQAPRVDALLDEAVYRDLLPITGFIQQDPQEGQPATEQTLVWILFDTTTLYVGARCRDSQPDRIVANDMRRDGRNVTQNDNISVVLDTFHDRRNGYEFLMNSIGGAWDTQITDESVTNRDWNTVWSYASRQDADGWTMEMAIPFRSLRYRGSGPQTWGINIRRNVRWKNELSYLSPVPRLYGARGILRLSQAATLAGLDLPPAALNLDIKPYAVANVQADRAVDPGFGNDFKPDGGFDLKYGLTQSLTADFTYRTDFAQVEDDDQQVNLTRFTLQYPEKREFFLEGQGLFAFGGVQAGTANSGTNTFGPSNTPLVFFSRQIGLAGSRAVPIEAGGRLTGKVGRYSIGLLDIQTGESTAASAVSTNFGVVRIKRDILQRSYVGLIATRRDPPSRGGSDNVALGVDASLWLARNLNVLGFYAGTRTPGRDGNDRSYRARVDYDADLFGLQVEHQAVQENFNPEIGFKRRQNFIESLVQLRVSRRPRSIASVRKINYEAGLDYITDGDERLENRQARLAVRTEMQSGDAWSVVYTRDFEFLSRPFEIIGGRFVAPGAYHGGALRGTYTLGTQRRVSGDFTVMRGSVYDGTRTDVSYRGRAELSRRLSLEPGISFNRVDVPGARFTATLLTTRAMFSFSPRMFVAALAQYNSTTHLTTTNLRFRWEFRPGSDIFLVYSDGRDTLGAGFGPLINRGVTLKITRLFRL